MIRPTILLLAMTIVLLLSSAAFAVPDTTGAHKDTIAIQVLEERVKQSAEKTQIQVEALQKQLEDQKEASQRLIEARNEAINRRVTDLDDASQRQTGIILVMVGFFLSFLTAFITFFGRKTLAEWIKKSISDKTDVLIKKHEARLIAQTEEATTAFLSKLNTQGKEATDAFISELEKDAKDASEEWAKVDKAREEYESLKDRMEKKVKELAALARPTVEPGVGTTEFQKKLSAVKDEAEYTAKDWHLLGNEAYERGDYEEAIRYYDNSIQLDPKHPLPYHNRGGSFFMQERYEEALTNYEMVIKLNPGSVSGYGAIGVTFSRMGRHKEALAQYERALEIAPETQDSLQNAVESEVILGLYDHAEVRAEKARALATSRDDIVSALYLMLVVEKLLGKDTSVTETEFDRILEEDFEVILSFDEIARWLEKADISEDAREFIRAKTALLKAKRKKR